MQRGLKGYELGNHLGNVLATISDKKTGIDANSDGIIEYYTKDVASAQDYYPFGMRTPGRKFSSNKNYRFMKKERLRKLAMDHLVQLII